MKHLQLPAALKEMLHGFNHETVNMGDTEDIVTRFFAANGKQNEKTLFLKTGKLTPEAYRERDMLLWLKGKLPVPDMLHWHETDNTYYMLTTAAQGIMACSERGLSAPEKDVLPALADGLLQFQNIDISDCPLESRLHQKLKTARYNAEHGLTDMYFFENNERFPTPITLYEYLVANKPPEDLTLTHGDYCLPNIFIANQKAVGFIDMGRGGIADKYQDIALCYRSLKYNTFDNVNENLFFECLGIKPDWNKIDYYILLDELF